MRLDRLLSIIIYLLNRDLVRARELADRFGVTIRTIQRDMESLQDAGIPIMTIHGPSGGYGIMNTWKLDRQLITIDNLFYILTALQGVSETLPTQGSMTLSRKSGRFFRTARTELSRSTSSGSTSTSACSAEWRTNGRSSMQFTRRSNRTG